MIETQLDDLIATLGRFRALLPIVRAAGEQIEATLSGGGKVLTAGNGGSAADALHLAQELMGRFEKERPPLRAVALCADAALLTCICNDCGFEQVFARQIDGLGKPGDALVVFSTSGKSPNILAALDAARARGLKTIAVLGRDGGPARGRADIEITVPSAVTARIQEVHTFILHSWLTQLERNITQDTSDDTQP